MTITPPGYNFELQKDFLKKTNPKIIKVLYKYIDTIYYEQDDKYYIREHVNISTQNVYCIDDFNSGEKYILLLELLNIDKIDLFILFLDRYKDIDISDHNNLLLNTACRIGSYEIISKLIDMNIDITFNNNIAIKIASYFLCFPYHNTGPEKIILTLKILLDNGADINTDNEYVLCCASDNIFVFKYLLDLGHRYDIFSRENYCLRNCIYKFSVNIIYQSCCSNESQNITKEKILTDTNGNNFVMSDIIKHLLDLGANIDCNNGYIINYIIEKANKNLLNFFINYDIDFNLLKISSLQKGIKLMDCDMIKLLVENGVDFSKLNNEPVEDLRKINTANLLLEIGLSHEKMLELI
ncbi:ankyrin repeat protein [Bandra megavirus]|uniref:Ankyrin repeat protein n=1 Tax=Bandra megavirus TaxID=2071566 RepID=A0A2K9V9W5_9VIRU|nr:ankyrin repeat protein [Bandra megavirus]